jgi:hypothetical protein
MMSTLGDVATTVDDAADDERDIARDVRTMQRQRDRGRSWAQVLDDQAGPGALASLRDSARRLAGAAAQLAHILAGGLAAEGQSRRQIARRLGVTHQRVSALLRNDPRPRPTGPIEPAGS